MSERKHDDERPTALFAHVEIPTDSFSRRIIDAAYAEFLSLGLRRATLDVIAKRAKVGRMTVHRRFPSKALLIETVLARENAAVVASLADVAAAQPTTLDALTEFMAAGIEALRHHPLFSRLLETDPEDIAPFLTFEAGPLMADSTTSILEQLGEATGTLEERRRAADAIFRVCHSILLAPDGLHDLRDPETLRGFLRPVIASLLPPRA